MIQKTTDYTLAVEPSGVVVLQQCSNASSVDEIKAYSSHGKTDSELINRKFL